MSIGAGTLIKARAALALRAAGNGLLEVARVLAWPRRRPRRAGRVCVHRIGNLGDTVCALPALLAIRRAYTDARFTLMTSPGHSGAIGASDFLSESGWFDEVLTYHSEGIADFRGRLRMFTELRRHRFDVWIELPAVGAPLGIQLRNMLTARMAGARWAAGWRLRTIGFAARAQSESMTFPNEVEGLLALVAGMGIPGAAEFALPIDANERRRAGEMLSEAGLAGATLVVMAPGAKRTPNRWPAERFGEVGCHLARRGFAVAIVGGTSDAAICAGVAESIGGAALNLAGRCTIRESWAVLERSALVICNDSGVQHLAAAAGVPCVSIFSCRDFPGMWYPHGPRHTVLRKWVPCHTCRLETCPRDNLCIGLITTDEVIEQAERKIRELGPLRGIDAPAAEKTRQRDYV
ncbi:MAG: glycosyltransferase family 9 protein [Candidatus Binataceae bacterium]